MFCLCKIAVLSLATRTARSDSTPMCVSVYMCVAADTAQSGGTRRNSAALKGSTIDSPAQASPVPEVRTLCTALPQTALPDLSSMKGSASNQRVCRALADAALPLGMCTLIRHQQCCDMMLLLLLPSCTQQMCMYCMYGRNDLNCHRQVATHSVSPCRRSHSRATARCVTSVT